MAPKKRKPNKAQPKGRSKKCDNNKNNNNNNSNNQCTRRRSNVPKWCQTDFGEVSEALAALGLCIKKITPDGNCMFRAVADQMLGDQDAHHEYRADVMKYFADHREEYAVFIEDDEPPEEYHIRMSREGEWGGHLELHLLSLITETNILVHQGDETSWELCNFPKTHKCIQLSYHDGHHYNSVRRRGQLEGPTDEQSLKQILEKGSLNADGVDVEGSVDASGVNAVLNACVEGATHAAACRLLKDTGGDVYEAAELLNAELLQSTTSPTVKRSESHECKADQLDVDAPLPLVVEASIVDEAFHSGEGKIREGCWDTKATDRKAIDVWNGLAPCDNERRDSTAAPKCAQQEVEGECVLDKAHSESDDSNVNLAKATTGPRVKPAPKGRLSAKAKRAVKRQKELAKQEKKLLKRKLDQEVGVGRREPSSSAKKSPCAEGDQKANSMMRRVIPV